MLLVHGPRSADYDFGPRHPLTPRRFGPGIDLLRSLGAEPGLAPTDASEAELRWCHGQAYIDAVRRLSLDPAGRSAVGIVNGGDVPPFAGMHEAGAMVAGGSIRAVEAILRGDVEHAFHPGGGLHHAMPDRASGFCIYDDPALAIARARQAGLRIMYIDLDVHHGDGVQAIHLADPGVLTVSFHESGRYLFPGTGDPSESGRGTAAGTSVNLPFEPYTGEGPWLAAVQAMVPELASAFGPDLIVSQHGADSHAWDPLAHLRVTTTAMSEAARLVDAVAHRYARGRWLATGGGGYDAYRVVPRMWSVVWLAGSHREVPDRVPDAFRARWERDAVAYGQAPIPDRFLDEPNAGQPLDLGQAAAESESLEMVERVRRVLVPSLVRVSSDRGWWDPSAVSVSGGSSTSGALSSGASSSDHAPTIVEGVDMATWERLALADRVTVPATPAAGHALVAGAIAGGAGVTAAIVGSVVVGLAVADPDGVLVALGVAPPHRRAGLATSLLRRSAATSAEVTVAERDPIDPLALDDRRSIARRLLGAAGFEVAPAGEEVRTIDPGAVSAGRSRPPTPFG